MLSLFKKKSAEPSIDSANAAYAKICGTDKGILRTELERMLYKNEHATSFQNLAETSLSFLEKKHQKLYFTALYVVLNGMVESGAVSRIKNLDSGIDVTHWYKMTPQGRSAYENSSKKIAAKLRRKDVEGEFRSFVDSSAFTDSKEFLGLKG